MTELTPDFYRHYGWLPGAFVLATLAAQMTLIYFFLRKRKAGHLIPVSIPSLPLMSYDAVLFGTALYVAAVGLGGLWFGLIAGGGVLFLWHLRTGKWGERFGAHRLKAGSLLGWGCCLALAAFLPLQILGTEIESLFHYFHWPTPPQPAVDLFLKSQGLKPLLQVLFFAVIFAPVYEELFFRGFLQPALKHVMPATWSMGLSALAFAGLHGHWISFVPLALFGFLLSVIYEMTGSLLLGIVIHALFNALGAASLLLVKFQS